MVENRKSPFPWILIGGGLLLLLVGMVWIISNRPSALPTTPTPASAVQVQRVTLDDAKAAHDSGTAVFLDVRVSSSYSEAHIPGAVNIPLSELPDRMKELNPKSWIITYCT